MKSMKAARAKCHSQASLSPIMCKMKNSLLVLCMIAATKSGMDGTVGIDWVGVAGGGPVVKTGCVEMESPLM